MKKSLFSFLMVAMVATVTFAFSPLVDAIYNYTGSAWEAGPGENCGGSAALCQISFDQTHVPYRAKIFSQISTQTAGTFSIFVDHDNNPDTPLVEVVVTLLRKTS